MPLTEVEKLGLYLVQQDVIFLARSGKYLSFSVPQDESFLFTDLLYAPEVTHPYNSYGLPKNRLLSSPKKKFEIKKRKDRKRNFVTTTMTFKDNSNYLIAPGMGGMYSMIFGGKIYSDSQLLHKPEKLFKKNVLQTVKFLTREELRTKKPIIRKDSLPTNYEEIKFDKFYYAPSPLSAMFGVNVLGGTINGAFFSKEKEKFLFPLFYTPISAMRYANKITIQTYPEQVRRQFEPIILKTKEEDKSIIVDNPAFFIKMNKIGNIRSRFFGLERFNRKENDIRLCLLDDPFIELSNHSRKLTIKTHPDFAILMSILLEKPINLIRESPGSSTPEIV